MLSNLPTLRAARSGRFSSWDTSGRNADAWTIAPGESRVLADIRGPGCITHIWMTQRNHYRECLLRFTWDNSPAPSIIAPLGDFFGLGHSIVNSYQSLLFSASTRDNNRFNQGCALNCYAPMPFRERALVELVNESDEPHSQYFYVDYESWPEMPRDDIGYFHSEFRRENPFGGWGHEIRVNTPEANAVNKERTAWDNNYVILEARGRGHYLGCNLSVTNFEWRLSFAIHCEPEIKRAARAEAVSKIGTRNSSPKTNRAGLNDPMITARTRHTDSSARKTFRWRATFVCADLTAITPRAA